jgi:hypothetical protein
MSNRLTRQGDNFDKQAKQYGLATSQELLAGPARYRWDLIQRDINALLCRRRDLPDGIPEPLVNYQASIYLACCMVENKAPPQELVHLIAQQLDVADFGLGRGKEECLIAAQKARQQNPTISNIALAQQVGVDKVTIGRWVGRGLLAPRGRGVAQ